MPLSLCLTCATDYENRWLSLPESCCWTPKPKPTKLNPNPKRIWNWNWKSQWQLQLQLHKLLQLCKVILTFNGQTIQKLLLVFFFYFSLSAPFETGTAAGRVAVVVIVIVSVIFVTRPGSVLSAAKSAAECVVADKINIITTGNGKNHVQNAQGEMLVQHRG